MKLRGFVRVVFLAVGMAMLLELGLIAYAIRKVPDPPTRRIRLQSGREVEVVWSGVVNNSTWMFEYRTRIPMRDRKALQREVQMLWPDVAEDANRAGMAKASVWPVNFTRQIRFAGWRPVVLGAKSTGFSLERTPEGLWGKSGGWIPNHSK